MRRLLIVVLVSAAACSGANGPLSSGEIAPFDIGYATGLDLGAQARSAGREAGLAYLDAEQMRVLDECETAFRVGYAAGYLGVSYDGPNGFDVERDRGYMFGWALGVTDGGVGGGANHQIVVGVSEEFDAGHIDGYFDGVELGLVAWGQDGYPQDRTRDDLQGEPASTCGSEN